MVPVSATITATAVGILSSLIVGVSIVMVLTWQVKIVMICANVLISVESMAILGLTLRVALKNKKPKPVIPKGPMFYDNEESDIATISASVVENQDVELPGIPMPSSKVMDVQEFLCNNHSRMKKS